MYFQTSFLAAVTLLTSALAAPFPIKRQAGGWSIRNFSRDCEAPNNCTYVFNIDVFGLFEQECTIVDDAASATTHSWYNIPCQEDSEYHISWGWNYQYDFTVMTVVYVPMQQEAFFGYQSPMPIFRLLSILM